MSAFLSKLFTIFQSKIAKTAMLALCCKISIAEVRLRFNLVRKSVPRLRCDSTESKSSLQKSRCASEIEKIKLHILRCAFTG